VWGGGGAQVVRQIWDFGQCGIKDKVSLRYAFAVWGSEK